MYLSAVHFHIFTALRTAAPPRSQQRSGATFASKNCVISLNSPGVWALRAGRAMGRPSLRQGSFSVMNVSVSLVCGVVASPPAGGKGRVGAWGGVIARLSPSPKLLYLLLAF